jgi:hypothetical protein
MGVWACRRMGEGTAVVRAGAGGHCPVPVHFVHYVHSRLAMPRHAAVSSVLMLIYPVFELDQRTLDLIDAFS